MENMPVSGSMAPPCLVPDGPGGVPFPLAWWWNGRDSNHQQTLRWVAKHKHGYPWGLSGRCKTFCCILAHAGRAAGRQAWPHRHQQWPAPLEKVCLQANMSILSLVASALLLPEDSGGEEVYWDFLLRFWEGRKGGCSAGTYCECGGCRAGKLSYKDWQSSLDSI